MKILKIIGIVLVIILIIFILLLTYAKYRLDNIKDQGDLAKLVDIEANKFINDGNVNGLVIGIVKHGQVYLKGYGTIKKGENISPDGTTIFELASTSKLFTTSVLQILSDNNLINLDESIQEILKDKITLPQIAQNTNLRNLATHTAGFPALPNSFLIKMTDTTNPYKDLVTQDIYDYLIQCEGKRAEGEFVYSNFGMGLLGHLLEIKTGKNYEKLVKEILLTPLEMNNTFITSDSLQQYSIAQGYNEYDQPTPIWIDHVLTGAGSFLSNGEDMIKFIKANLNEDYAILSNSLVKSQKKVNNLKNGLGWLYPDFFDKFMGEKNIVWHNGMAGGYSSYIAIDRINNFGIIVLSNKSFDVTTLGMTLARYTRTQSWKK